LISFKGANGEAPHDSGFFFLHLWNQGEIGVGLPTLSRATKVKKAVLVFMRLPLSGSSENTWASTSIEVV